jgi:hypothetical protein
MPSPFPGMDPYLEYPYWEDFHATFIPFWRRVIEDVLPPHYVARIDAKTNLIEVEPHVKKVIGPDVAVIREERSARTFEGSFAAVAIKPVTLTLPAYVEVRERWIEIINEPENTLVAVLELLSPSNKFPGSGRAKYLAKRSKLIRQDIHLIEVDLLLGGLRLPMAEPMPDGDYFAVISRAEMRPKSDVYAWQLRDKLPSIPIPLLKGDSDVSCDMGTAFAAAYELGGYANRLKYAMPLLDVPIPESDRQWVAGLAKSAPHA